jgi:hypothetical protein
MLIEMFRNNTEGSLKPSQAQGGRRWLPYKLVIGLAESVREASSNKDEVQSPRTAQA